MTVKLCQASVQDLSLVLPLVSAYHEFEGLSTADLERESATKALLANSDYGVLWLIYADQDIVGYIALCCGYSIEFNGIDAFVDEFFLVEPVRGQGVGTEVLNLIKEEARNLKIRALHLEVARDNRAAKRLYSKLGFQAREKYMLMSVDLVNHKL